MLKGDWMKLSLLQAIASVISGINVGDTLLYF